MGKAGEKDGGREKERERRKGKKKRKREGGIIDRLEREKGVVYV